MNRNARIGLLFFAIYLAAYGGFVFLTAFGGDVMASTPIAGLNLSILYGFGLIVGAIVLAVAYGVLCDTGER